jgi:hypothetical protein
MFIGAEPPPCWDWLVATGPRRAPVRYAPVKITASSRKKPHSFAAELTAVSSLLAPGSFRGPLAATCNYAP